MQMVKDLNEPREKLITKHDWLISALYALASAQTSCNEAGDSKDVVNKAITKLREQVVVDPLKPSEADIHLLSAEDKKHTRVRP
jgi:hypothetical protein